MSSVIRGKIIEALLSLLVQGPIGNRRSAKYVANRLRQLTAEPIYAIPTDVLNLLSQKIPGWLRPDELEREHKLTRCCNNAHAIAIFQGRFVLHPFFSRPTMPTINSAMLRKLRWAGSTVSDVEQGLHDAKHKLDAVLPRREAYLGWLMTSPVFLAERDTLRNKWQGAVSKLDDIPAFPVRRTLELRGLLPAQAGSKLDGMADDLTTFFERWDLLGMATWDLPQPKVGNFGCPAVAGNYAGVSASPTVQLPKTLRLPARFPLDGLFNVKIDDHLAEWRAIEDQRHPGSLNYARLRQVFHLHFLQNIVLGRGYRDRFHRHIGLLEKIFAEYFGYDNEETLRKLRHWIDRRLKPKPMAAPSK